MRYKTLFFALGLALLALAPLLLHPQPASNRGWKPPNLKPGAILTTKDLEKLEEMGWRVVQVEGVYRYIGASPVYGRCNTTLFLVKGLEATGWDPGLQPYKPIVEVVKLSQVANATIYYKPARLYYAYKAYCLKKINETAYRVTGLIKHAYIGWGKGKPRRIIVKVNHEKFEKLLISEWFRRLTRAWGLDPAITYKLLNRTEVERWARIERQVCNVIVELDVPIIRFSKEDYYNQPLWLAYPNTYLRQVILPLAKLIGCYLAKYWLFYSRKDVRNPYPPNWLVRGATCWQWAEWDVRILRMLGKPAYILNIGDIHEATVLCTNETRAFASCYGLLAVDLVKGKKVICWLLDDTGYAMSVWSDLPKLRAIVYPGRQPTNDGIYKVVKSWMVCKAPQNIFNITAERPLS